MNPRFTNPIFRLVLVACWAFAAPSLSLAGLIQWTDGSGFADLNNPSAGSGVGSWNWKGLNDLTIQGDPTNSSSLFAAPSNFTYNFTPTGAAPFLSGAVETFNMRVQNGQSASLTISFANSFTSSDRWIWTDIDRNEIHQFRAFDSASNLLDLSGWTHTTVNATAGSVNPADFALFSLGLGNTVGTFTASTSADLADPTNILRPDTDVARIEIFSWGGGIGAASPTITFASVPEPSSIFMFGAATTILLCSRRRVRQRS